MMLRYQRVWVTWSLLLLGGAVAAVAGCWALEASERRHKAVLKRLLAAGARVEPNRTGVGISVYMIGDRFTNQHIAWIRDLKDVRELVIEDAPTVTDAGIARLSGLKGLQELVLIGCGATGKCLNAIGTLQDLRVLYIPGLPVAGADLAKLRTLTQLNVLFLDGTSVRDADVVSLRSLGALKWLSLRDTQVTDAGILHLQQSLSKARIIK